LGEQVQKMLYKNQIIWAFDKSGVLTKLTELQREKICNNCEHITLKKNEVVFAAGATVDKIVFVIKGALKLGTK
jgi:CRP-like cAMP-binding protein